LKHKCCTIPRDAVLKIKVPWKSEMQFQVERNGWHETCYEVIPVVLKEEVNDKYLTTHIYTFLKMLP
jgi:hypothetical protein